MHSLTSVTNSECDAGLPPTLSNNILKLSNDRKFHGCRPANSLHRNCGGHCHIVWGIFYIHGVPELAPLLSSSGD
jgi:hypothetical protein